METIQADKYPLMGSNKQYDMGIHSFVERQPHQMVDMTLDKVINLLQDQHSKSVKERHVRAVKKICQRFEDGFYLKDLVKVLTLIDALVERLEGDEEYTAPVIQIIMLCGKSFLKEKASDDTIYAKDLVEFLTELSKLVELPVPMIQIAVTHCIGSLYCTPVTNYPDGPQACKHELNIKTIEESNIVQIFANELRQMTDETVYQEILHLLLFLSLSSSNCDSLLGMDVVDVIAKSMAGACSTNNSKLLQLSVEVLWNIIEYGNPERIPEKFETNTVVRSLYSTFLHFVKHAKTQQDMQLRNDVMSVVLVLLSHCPKPPLLECGFVEIMSLIATHSEVKTKNPLVEGFNMKPHNDDFELKKQSWAALISLSADDAMRQVMLDMGLLTALFDYVRPNDSVCTVEWTSAQYEELQLQALSGLECLSPLCLGDYMKCHGNTRLILLLEWACTECDFGGHGNSFFGEGGYQTRRAQLRYTIRVLLAVVRTGNENVVQDLCDQGLIDALLVVLKKYQDTNVSIELGILSNTLLILSVVCETDSHRKALFGDDGVTLLLKFLSGDSDKFSSGLGYHKLLLSAVNAVWCCVSNTNQDLFLERGGIPILLSLLEKCPPSMQNLVLGALLDLTEDPRAVSHVVTWRGVSQITAVSLLVSLWRQEEAAMGVKRDLNNVMIDPGCPLQGIEQQQSEVSAHALSSTPTLAILDVGDNMRAKIYAMLYRIGFDKLPPLPAKDQITLTLIENYLDFKVGEVWQEIISELMVDNITPIRSDRDALREVQQIIGAKSEAVKRHQLEILEREQVSEQEDEQACYEQIRSNYKQWEQQNDSRINFISKTSDYETLQMAKQKQSSLAEKSRREPPSSAGMVEHNTLLRMLTTTVHSGRHINIPLSETPPPPGRDITSPHKVLPAISPRTST